MHVGTLKVGLYIPGCGSLKEKRHIVRSLIDRTHREFRVAIAEVEHLDLHERSTLGIACVSNESGHANAMLDKVLDFIETKGDASISLVEMEILHL